MCVCVVQMLKSVRRCELREEKEARTTAADDLKITSI